MSDSFDPRDGWDESGAIPEDDPALSAAWQLVRGPHPVLADEAVERIEARLAQALAGSQPVPAQRTRGQRVRRWMAAAVLLLVGAALLVMWLAADALPGETLYPVKRGVEDVRLALAGDETAVDLHLTFAERRLDEFADLLARGSVDLDTLDDGIDDLDAALDLLDTEGRSGPQAARLLDVSVHAVGLAEAAGARAVEDRAVLAALSQRIDTATAVGVAARQLDGFEAAPAPYFAAYASDTALYIPGDLPALHPLSTDLDAGSTGTYIVP